MTVPLLAVKKISMRFGGLKALSDFSLEVRTGDLKGLIGPNGAGKTTAFNLITGVYQPTSGRIAFRGQATAGVKPYALSLHGISRTFQNIRLFASLNVFDNVLKTPNRSMRIDGNTCFHSFLFNGLNCSV